MRIVTGMRIVAGVPVFHGRLALDLSDHLPFNTFCNPSTLASLAALASQLLQHCPQPFSQRCLNWSLSPYALFSTRRCAAHRTGSRAGCCCRRWCTRGRTGMQGTWRVHTPRYIPPGTHHPGTSHPVHPHPTMSVPPLQRCRPSPLQRCPSLSASTMSLRLNDVCPPQRCLHALPQRCRHGAQQESFNVAGIVHSRNHSTLLTTE